MSLATSQPAILIVDDDTAILAILKRFLRDLTPDYELIALSDPTDALLPLQAGVVRLMISDVALGEMDGLQLTELAKRIAPSTRILLLTGAADSDLKRRAYAAGVDAVLAKPFRLDRLDELVHRLLG